ncbi:MAG: hypothetical protein AB1Z29_24275 [Desulfobacterales bacterium]
MEAGFEAVFKSRDIPPVIHYEGNIDKMDVEIEFLADQTGSNTEIVLEVQKGLYAEALRFISIVIENVTEVTIDVAVSVGHPSPLIVKVSAALFSRCAGDYILRLAPFEFSCVSVSYMKKRNGIILSE